MSTRGRRYAIGESGHDGFGSAAVMPLAGGASVPADAAREVWASALCAQVDPELFFPEKGQPSAPAKAICSRCPVTALCLRTFGPLVADGVVGGLTAQERRQHRQPDRPAAA
jgi:WhiB family redox-sensing transcriptional regulator